MKKLFIIIPLLAASLLLLAWKASDTEVTAKPQDQVIKVLEKLGERTVNTPDLSRGASAEQGKELVLYGITKKKNGKKTKKQSKHFVCTSCHNVVQDTPDLTKVDPESKLEYSFKNNLPFLQGTSLYGAVNRTSFYNGDYFKKYGDLVTKARNNIREAIQLCAIECSQGRKLKKWEMESVLAYLWEIGFKMEDLNLTEEEYIMVNDALSGKMDRSAAINMIKSKYRQDSPAEFTAPPEDRKVGYGTIGNPNNGKKIYDLGCKHCHEQKRYSFFNLDDSPLTFKHLKKHFPNYSRYSPYQVIRYGTPPMNGKRAYMPQYPLEKMTNQQVEDLRSYVEMMAK